MATALIHTAAPTKKLPSGPSTRAWLAGVVGIALAVVVIACIAATALPVGTVY